MNLDPVDPSQFGLPENSIIYGCEPQVIKAIIACRMRFRGVECLTRFWERILTEQERTELGEIGLSTEQATPDFSGRAGELPVWNTESGELTLRGDVLRSIRVRIANNIVRVPDGFQNSG